MAKMTSGSIAHSRGSISVSILENGPGIEQMASLYAAYPVFLGRESVEPQCTQPGLGSQSHPLPPAKEVFSSSVPL